ncbi:MAG TPA: polysaccharide biosynthesis/export family protein [Flavobacteriaceae bacterium]|nr:polysaccharide biosynthesis/export family protein [Flavobacteriaceae bacterium]
MKLYYFILVVVLLSFATSCIPTKQLTYLQENPYDSDTITILRKRQEPYRLQINDLLSVRIKVLDQERVGIFNPVSDANPNATGEERLYYDGFVVNDQGTIRMPVLGQVDVLGLTVDEVREKLEEMLLRDYFKEEANLFVTVKLAGIRYTINGEINRPGSSIIYRDQVSIMEAIANNGDIAITGDRSDVVIIRQYPAGQRVHRIDLTRLDAMDSSLYYVKPNDLILINPLPQKSWGTGVTGLDSFRTLATIISALSTTALLIKRL